MDEDLKRKIIKYSIIGFVIFVIFVFILALFSSRTKKEIINSSEKSISLTTGEKYSLNYVDYTWTSSDNSIAIVNNSGEIEALKNGNASVVVNTNNEKITYNVSVNDIDNSVVLSNIKMEKNTIELAVNDTFSMNVKVVPSNASNTNLTWYSTNENVAVVENGVIKAVGSGTCMITVKSSNGYTDTCLVKVKGKSEEPTLELESLSFDTTSLVLKKDIIYTIKYDTVPSEVNANIYWETSDNSVVLVENGVIKTVGVGSATIVAKSGSIEETMYITVVEGDENTPEVIDDGKEVKATSITLNQENIVLTEGDSYTLTSIIKPDNTTNKQVTWSSSDSTIVSVDNYGNIKALKSGEANIVVKTSNDISATCIVKVNEKVEEKKEEEKKEEEPPEMPDEEQENIVERNISLNLSNVSLNVGDTIQLIETVTPDNEVSSVYWSSSNPDIARVSKGFVTAVSGGNVVITAELPNGNAAKCYINVSSNGNVVNAFLISLNAKQVNLKVGGTFNFTASILPSNTTNKTITWTSSNNKIVSVDNNGKVTAIASGSALITAKTSNGVIAKAAVIVEESVTKASIGISSDYNLESNYTNVIKYNGREYKVYKQRFFRNYPFWRDGNLADNGSAPLSLAIILSGYLNDVYPSSIGDYMKYGSFNQIANTAQYYGFSTEGPIYFNSSNNIEKRDSVLNKIRQHINNGYPLIALVTKSTKCSPKNKYSGSDSFIAILGELPSGELIIGNPGISDGSGTLEEMMNCYMEGGNKGFLLLTPNNNY